MFCTYIISKMNRNELRIEATRLRKEGYSYNLIAEKLDVSKGTLHHWLSQIPYTPNREVRERIGEARARAGEAKHKQKLASFMVAKRKADDDIRDITARDLFMLGIGLYIGEGEKNENIGIINSDPQVIRLGISWLREACRLDVSNLTLAIHLYPDNNKASCLKFWSKTTGIPLFQFGKTQIDRRGGKRNGRRGKLPYGTAHLRVRSNGNPDFGVTLSRRIHAWMNRVFEMRA